MRDLIVFFLVFASLPMIFGRPWIGILMWCWLGFMNPHRLTWGFAYDFPFSLVVGATTLLAFAISRDRKAPDGSALLTLWVMLFIWFNITTAFAMNPVEAIPEWIRFLKVQLFCFLALFLMQSKQRIVALVWVIALSLGFYGLRGGIFALVTGGQFRVYGPDGSFFDDNNAMGLVLIMTIPLLRFLQMQFERKQVRLMFAFLMLCSFGAVLSTHSRGALLAGLAMVPVMILNSRRKLLAGVLTVIALPLLAFAMPQSWWSRMATIETYQQDGSAMGRINAWHFAANIAKEHPITGGGFDVFTRELFLRYAPNPTDFHDAHSNYFEVLGEQGYPGLILYLGVLITAMVMIRRTMRMVRTSPPDRKNGLVWASDLSAMLQASLIGYAVGGAFLGLAYFDLYYTMIALILLLHQHVRRELAQPVTVSSPATSAAEPLPANGGHPDPYGAVLRRVAEPTQRP